jgi:hypothetical protein
VLVGLLSVGFAFGAWSRAGLYWNHQVRWHLNYVDLLQLQLHCMSGLLCRSGVQLKQACCQRACACGAAAGWLCVWSLEQGRAVLQPPGVTSWFQQSLQLSWHCQVGINNLCSYHGTVCVEVLAKWRAAEAGMLVGLLSVAFAFGAWSRGQGCTATTR